MPRPGGLAFTSQRPGREAGTPTWARYVLTAEPARPQANLYGNGRAAAPSHENLRWKGARVEIYAWNVTTLSLDHQAVLASLDHPLDAAAVGAALLSAWAIATRSSTKSRRCNERASAAVR